MKDKVNSPAQTDRETNRWENEGGSGDVFRNALPDGIATRTVREYIVGRYRYTDLGLAIAERDRQRIRD